MTSPPATDVFSGERSRLFGLAYRMLGSVADAEDAVQETFLRWDRSDQAAVQEPGRWLATVLTRHCMDVLRSARRRREAYVGVWLPEPLLSTDDDPADRVTMDESLSLALLVVLESLSPAERAVFVLHDVFGLTFDEIGEMVGRTPAACRQLGSRARRNVDARRPRYETDGDQQRRLLAEFLEAAQRGDLQGVVRLLDPSVVFRGDGGGKVQAAPRPIDRPERVARVVLSGLRSYPGMVATPASMSGGIGLVLTMDGAVIGVLCISVAGGRLTEIDIVVNPDKLGRVRPPA